MRRVLSCNRCRVRAWRGPRPTKFLRLRQESAGPPALAFDRSSPTPRRRRICGRFRSSRLLTTSTTQDLIEYNGAAREFPIPTSRISERSHRLHGAALRSSRSGVRQSHAQRRADGDRRSQCQAAAMAASRSSSCSTTTTTIRGATAESSNAIWGRLEDAVRMIYDDKVWAMFGSISGDTTHIALRWR
jgi:hypothetical protein